MKKPKQIYVGELGESIISSKGVVDVYYILEEDGTKSWQLNPDTVRGDIILKTVKVIPLEPESREAVGLPRLFKSKKSQVPLTMTKLPKLGSKGSGWHKEPISHSYARKNGKAPARVRGR